MKLFFEDWLLLNLLELGLEVLQTSGIAATVRATTSIGNGEACVLNFLAIDTPIVYSQT
jgi:hypothetical protein